MDVTLTDQNQWILVSIQGRVDSFNQQILDDKLSTLVRAGKNKIILDLTRSPYLSLSAAWLINRTEKRISTLGGSLTVVTENELAKKLLMLFSAPGKLKIIRQPPSIEPAL